MIRGETAVTQQGFCYAFMPHTNKEKPYEALSRHRYYSPRYNRSVLIELGMRSDGASGAVDIVSLGWWPHDKLTNSGRWEDGTPCTNWQASCVLSDILWSEGRKIRSIGWLFATFFFGGKKTKLNGMFRRKAK